MTSSHETYMQRCLQLAQLGAGHTAPNPMVGAVLVHDNSIIGEGYHEKYGKAHAEVNCMAGVHEEKRRLIPASTLYVSLEPCAHYGKTPPCADLIVRHHIPRVVIGCRDVYKEVNGKGIEKLRAAGIEVITGILEKECRDINKRFFAFHEKKRPYIILKWAQSGNGKISASLPGHLLAGRTLISNAFTNRLVHKWRSEEAGIMIGTNTALQDDPQLTTRLWKGGSPLRIVIDKNLRLPPEAKVFDKAAPTIIFNQSKEEESGNILYAQMEKENVLRGILLTLYKKKVQSILVEGGAKLLQSFIDEGLWDEARIICNESLLIDGGIAAPLLTHGHLVKKENYLNDSVMYLTSSA